MVISRYYINNIHLNVIYNFIQFVEDVLKKPEALWSSYDGTHLLYASFNDTNVGIMSFPWFATSKVLAAGGAATRATTFPSSKTIRYPTVNTQNN